MGEGGERGKGGSILLCLDVNPVAKRTLQVEGQLF